jgi:hypothetical protein
VIDVCVLSVDGVVRDKNLINFLHSHNLDYKIFQGVDGSLFSKSEFKKANLINDKVFRDGDISTQEISCSVGHMDIYKYLELNQNVINDWTLILEDDAILNIEIIDLLKCLRENHYVFESKPTLINLYSESFITTEYKSINFNTLYFKLDRCLVIPSGTVAYIINKNFINFFKNEFMIIKDKADWPVKFFKKSLFLMVSPQLIKTNQHGSLIQKNIEIKFTKIEASHLIRKVKRIQNYKLELYKIYIREIKIVLIYLFMKKSKYKQRGFW